MPAIAQFRNLTRKLVVPIAETVTGERVSITLVYRLGRIATLQRSIVERKAAHDRAVAALARLRLQAAQASGEERTALEAQIAEAQANLPPLVGLAESIVALVESWDVTHDDGTPVALDVETLQSLDIDNILRVIEEFIHRDARPGKALGGLSTGI